MARYDESSIKSLDWKEHIRFRPGMYIGKLGDGSSPDDGIYVLIKEVLDNSIDEHTMGYGSRIEVLVADDLVRVRDFGRGIPLGKMIDCVSKINTGAKYDSEAFKKSVGLNGVGTKAVNALSSQFKIVCVRDGKLKSAKFEKGELIEEAPAKKLTKEIPSGTYVEFVPDDSIFKNFRFRTNFLDEMLWNYAHLNAGLKIVCNDKDYFSKNGLLDLLQSRIDGDEIRYPIIHIKGKDVELAMTHGNGSGEDFYTFVNGQYTTMGGTHLQALRETLVKCIRDFYKKNFDPGDVRSGIICALSVRVQEPVFESQTKTKLGSQTISPGGQTIRSWLNETVGKQIDIHLHKNPKVAEKILKRIQEAEKERKELAGIKKLAKERTKKANLYNKKLRDCKVHFNTSHRRKKESSIFITEGDSASGSITSARDAFNQAVFSLRGKPLNTFGMRKKIVYENEELNLLQHALNLDEGLDGIRYNRIIIATDADVDGMHIRLLLLTFFLQFFPEIVKAGHVYILQTPLFRVRNKKETVYCYDEKEREKALKSLGKTSEITRFKGLGEISPSEFGGFIGKDIRLDQVRFVSEDREIAHTLRFYMGKNSVEKQTFIINNLRVEEDLLEA